MSHLYERVSRVLLYALIFLTPLFFLPISLDPLEINKQTLLILLSFGATLAWVGSMVSGRTIQIRRGWFNLFPILIVLVTVLSAVFSRGRYQSFIGSSTQEYVSVLGVLAYAAVFYLVANLLVTPQSQRVAFACFLGSAAVAGLVGVFSMFGVNVIPFSGGTLSNTVGTMNAFAVYLAVAAVFANALYLAHRESDALVYRGWRGAVEHGLIIAVSLLALFVLLAVDYGPIWAAFVGGLLALFAIAIVRARDFEASNRFILPFFLIVLSLPFWFWLPTPLPLKLPVEVTPSFASSWTVAKETLGHGAFLLGSGPGTFAYQYAQYRPVTVNQTAFWSTRFDRGANYALTLLATTGVLGALAWLAFGLFALIRSGIEVVSSKARNEWLPAFVVLPAWFTLALGLFLYSGNLTLLASFFLLSGFIGAQVMKKPLVRSFKQSPRLALLFSLLFVLVSIGIVTAIFVTTQRYVAEVAFAQAVRLDADHAPIQDVVTSLDRAATFNRYDDIYYRNLSQAFLVQAGDEISKLGSTQDMSADKRQYIQALTGASVNASVHATDLAPDNVLNWSARGAVYREFIPLIGNAGTFSVSAYQSAIALDPNDPELPTELGKTWFALAENSRTLTASKDPKVAADATKAVDDDLQKAEEQFNRSVALKADYAPAHYQLGLVYERQGKLSEAVGKMESVAKYNPLDVGVFFQLGLLYLRRGDKGDTDRAQASFEKAIDLSPSYANARWFLASIYEQKNELDKAIEQVQKVLDLNPDNQLVKARLDRLKAGKTSAAAPAPLPEPQPTPAP